MLKPDTDGRIMDGIKGLSRRDVDPQDIFVLSDLWIFT